MNRIISEAIASLEATNYSATETSHNAQKVREAIEYLKSPRATNFELIPVKDIIKDFLDVIGQTGWSESDAEELTKRIRKVVHNAGQGSCDNCGTALPKPRCDYCGHTGQNAGQVGEVETLNTWFTSLPEERQRILRDDKWMLSDSAFEAGKQSALRTPQPQPVHGVPSPDEIQQQIDKAEKKGIHVATFLCHYLLNRQEAPL